MEINTAWDAWKFCAKIVIVFFLFMIVRTILFPETRTSRLPKQLHSNVEKVAERASHEQESTLMRSLVDNIKGED